MRRLYDATDTVFARIDSSGNAAWCLTDRLGSVRDIESNSTQAILDHLDYDAYGKTTNETQPGNGDRFKYAGGYFEATTGLYHFGAREYDPATGRWRQEDPSGFSAGDSNLDRYVGNGPTDATDPTGEYQTDVHYGMTYFLALAAGIPNDVSRQIAWATQFTDVHPKTQPVPINTKNPAEHWERRLTPVVLGNQFQISNEGHRALLVWHFPTEKQGATVKRGSDLAMRIALKGIENKDPILFGMGLHTYEDSWSHEGFKPIPGHMLEGATPDLPYVNEKSQAKALEMAEATYKMMVRFREKVYPDNKVRLEWNKKLKDQLLTLFKNDQNERRRLSKWLTEIEDTFNLKGVRGISTDYNTNKMSEDPQLLKAYDKAIETAIGLGTPWQADKADIDNANKQLQETFDSLRRKKDKP
jgi:RHS repeat-associated protein